MVLDSTSDARSPVSDVFALASELFPGIVKVIPESSVNVHAYYAVKLLRGIVDEVQKNNVTYWCYINRNGLGGGANFNARLQDSPATKAYWMGLWE